MSRLPPILAGLILLLAPFGEGGRAPLSLLVLHTLALAFVLAVAATRSRAMRPEGACARAIPSLVAAALILAVPSALRAGYPLAAGLGVWDQTIAAALFLAAGFRAAGEGEAALLRDLAVASTALQAILALARGARGGVMEAGAGFLNPNHLAAFLGLGLLLSAAAADAARAAGRRRRFRVFMAAGGLDALALVRLQSRGATLALAAALLLFAALGWRSWRLRARFPAAVAIGALLAASLALLGPRLVSGGDPYLYHRLRIWGASLRMLEERPLLGFGPGMFRHVVAAYNVPLDAGPVRFGRIFESAHSGWLTLAVEDGAPAAIALLGAAALTIATLLRRGRGEEGVFRGAGIALFALLVHAMVEDLEERPALTLVPALLAGAALGAALRRPRAASADLERRAMSGAGLRWATATAALYAFVAAILLPYLAHRQATLARYLGRAGIGHMERAAILNPLHPEYRHDLAMAALNQGPPGPEQYVRAALDLLEARRLKPVDYRFPLLLGRLEAEVGRRLFDDPSAGRRAEAYYREAAAKAPLDPRPLLEYAGCLDALGRPEEALEQVRRALSIEPRFLRARILETSILLRAGRLEEARRAFVALGETVSVLQRYAADSAYARDLVADDPGLRQRLAGALAAPEPPSSQGPAAPGAVP